MDYNRKDNILKNNDLIFNVFGKSICAPILQYKHCKLPLKFKLNKKFKNLKTIFLALIQCTYILLNVFKDFDIYK